MGLLDFVNHIEEDQHICRQGSEADNEVNGRIVGGIHCIFAHVLEGREGLCEHAPEGQSMGSVLQPCAFAYRECANRRRQEQGKTAVPCVVRQAVVCIGEVPKVISDDPEPQHIRPEHVFAAVFGSLFSDTDAQPAGDGEDVQDAGCCVHVVPGAAQHVDVLHGIGHITAAGEGHAHFDVAGYGFTDVDCQNQRREAEGDLVVCQSPGHFSSELIFLFDMSDAPETDTACSRRVDFGEMEPVGVGHILQGCKPENGQDDRQNDEAEKSRPFPAPGYLIQSK